MTGDVLARRLLSLAQRGQRTPCQSAPAAWYADDPEQRADPPTSPIHRQARSTDKPDRTPDEGATTMTHPNPIDARPMPDDLRADVLTDPTADQLAASVRCPECRGRVRVLNRPRLGVLTAEIEHDEKCPRWVYRFPEAAVAMGPPDDHDGHLLGRVVSQIGPDMIVRLRHPDGVAVHP